MYKHAPYLFELGTRCEDLIFKGAEIRNMKIPIFVLMLINFYWGNKVNAMLKQQFISCKLLIYVPLVNRRQIANFNSKHHSLDIIYLPGKKKNGMPPIQRVPQFE